MLTEKEISRYSRHLLLPEIGIAGQEKLKNANVLVIGAGGLGCPVLMYLAAAGIGKIGIVDFDSVDESNLQRQVLYDVSDIGRSKSESAKQKLCKQNPFVEIESIPARLSTLNALELFSKYDIIVDGTDNFSTRYLVNDACVLTGRPLVSGSIFKFQGQISVFNFKDHSNIFGPTYRCLFPSPPVAGSVPSCSEVGVLGVLPGMIGTLMASEVIKIVTGIGQVLSGKILLVDLLAVSFQEIKIERNEDSIQSAPKNSEQFEKMNYDYFCGMRIGHNPIRQVSVEELKRMLRSRESTQLLDVREPGELPEIPELNDLKIPLGTLENKSELVARDRKVVVLCRSGNRSTKAIELLSQKFGFQNLYNLTGGVTEWVRSHDER